MANIPDQTPAWAPVPMIETNDLVLGGPDGQINRQASAVLQRAQFLRSGLETVTGTVAGIAEQVGVSSQSLSNLQTSLQAVVAEADTALSVANTARTRADSATTKAESATTAAAAAQSDAASARTMAESSNTTAASAKATADSAAATASTANTNATAAKTTADNAAATAGTANTTANTARTIAEARAIRFDLPNATVTYSVTLALGAGARSIEANCTGARAGDAIFVSPVNAVPDGYGVGAAQCLANDKIRVSIVHPALALGANFSIPLRVFALRTGP